MHAHNFPASTSRYRGMYRTARNFISVPGAGVAAPDFARFFDWVDPRHIKAWLNFCRKSHTMCSLRLVAHIPGFKLIDCYSRKVCRATLAQPYVALSYVWGSNITEDKNIATDVFDRFPQTIDDAILVAKQIGIPHIWVDRYCIDHNDQNEKHVMISKMDRIYSGAELTIIASSGTTPHHGLPGVSKPRHPRWRRPLNPGFLDYVDNPVSEMRSGPWSKRGWTFQELLVSRRRLIFTESQVMFQCCDQVFLDSFSSGPIDAALPGWYDTLATGTALELGCPSELLNVSTTMHMLLPHVLVRESKGIYALLTEFSVRTLTYPEDKLDAMEGIFSAFRETVRGYVNHFWGIPILDSLDTRKITPTVSFCVGLQWLAYTRDKSLPNWPWWSWVARDGWIEYDWAVPAALNDGVRFGFIRHDGSREDLEHFARGEHSYKEYRPWIEVETWVGPSKHLTQGFEADCKDRMIRASDVGVYIGMRFDDVEYFSFLVVEETERGSFRRVGLAKRAREDSVGYLSNAEVVLWEERIRRESLTVHDFFQGWDHRTIRLV